MTLTTERQQFEEWFTNKYPRSHWGIKKTASGEYQGGLTAQLWLVWQESRWCMANREAQPVAWEMRYWSDGYNIWGEWERITAEQHAEMSVKHATDNDYEFRVLYDAPPAPKSNAADWGINMQTGTPILVYKNCSVIESEQAHYVLSLINNAPPAPAVPGEIMNCLAFFASVIKGGEPWTETCQRDYDAARHAAMLAQPDGWVACSERMPEPNTFVQVSNGVWVGIGMYNDAEHFEDDERWQDEHNEFIDLLHHPVTHWMPLPAVPSVVGAPRADSSKGEGL